MISRDEILGQFSYNTLDNQLKENLEKLLDKINQVRTAWGKPMIVTSGYRSKAHHIEIYKDLAKQRGQVFDISKVPMGSRHLTCQAVDISDPDGSLYQWTHDNEKLMESIGVWMEVKDDQARVHFQTVPPGSGRRWFNP